MSVVTDREERLAKNEALFRGVNERVRELKSELSDPDPDALIDFICECGRSDCVEQVQLAISEYERVRAEPEHFVLKPGHEALDVERVLSEADRFIVVAKHEEEAVIARETDPRAPG
jgi:hypothetical protein